jgi:hypothetical protein
LLVSKERKREGKKEVGRKGKKGDKEKKGIK